MAATSAIVSTGTCLCQMAHVQVSNRADKTGTSKSSDRIWSQQIFFLWWTR